MKKKRLTIFDKLMLALALAAAAGMILGMVAGKIDPNDNILFAFAGLAYPFLLVANIGFAFYWLFRNKLFFLFVSIFVLAIGWRPLTSTLQLFGDNGDDKKANAEYLRVMTYNVHQFKRYGEGNNASTKDQILEVIERQNPDVICFQEFFTRHKGEFDLLDTLKKRLGLKYVHFVPSIGNDYEEAGLAIFSKYPLENKGKISFEESAGNGSIYADVRVGEKVFRLFNVHFQSISFQKEDYEYIDKVANKMDAQYGSSRRIARMLKDAFKKRARQVEIMKAEMDKCKLPFVIAGDFNDTPASYCVTKITDSLKSTFKEKGIGFGKTYNGAFPNFQIDYIATTRNFDVINHHISKAKLSDHFPVRSDLRLNFTSKSTTEN
jgi:endonuclease/exonuclease/phosphatase family metal-dependent hydrolase